MGKCRVPWLCFHFLRLSRGFRRCSPSKRTLIVATVCLINFSFLVLKVMYLEQPRGGRGKEEQRRHTREEHHINGVLSASDPQTQASLEVPTRPNVVYITVKFKRLKPANIRGTLRPKLRKKMRRKPIQPSVTQRKRFRLERNAGRANQSTELETFWRDVNPAKYSRKSYNDGTDSHMSTIQIYSQMAPSWFSAQDVKSMRLLADVKVLRLKESSSIDAPSLLLFEGADADPLVSQKLLKTTNICRGQCGIVHCSVDSTEVFAFHLDRVLGLNRTIPAVSRKLGFLHDGQTCQVVLWDATLHPEELAAGPTAVRMTWREYQNSLTQRCWHGNVSPKSNSGCSSIHHSEWSKLALFDFLLQIHNRLDPSCCGFRPRQEDACVDPGWHAACDDQQNLQLANIVHREHDLRRLVFTNNHGFFDRGEENLNFRLLEGIKENRRSRSSFLNCGETLEHFFCPAMNRLKT